MKYTLISMFLILLVSREGLPLPTKSVEKVKRQIPPGTKWCGDSNIASGSDDSAANVATEVCGETHDQCEHKIAAGEQAYGLENNETFSVSDCKCDLSLARCLLDAADPSKTLIVNEKFAGIISRPCITVADGIGTWHESPAIANTTLVRQHVDQSTAMNYIGHPNEITASDKDFLVEQWAEFVKTVKPANDKVIEAVKSTSEKMWQKFLVNVPILSFDAISFR